MYTGTKSSQIHSKMCHVTTAKSIKEVVQKETNYGETMSPI